MCNTKNYTAHGGAETVIGGKLTFLEGAEVSGLPAGGLPSAAADAKGGVKLAANQAASTASSIAELKADVNTLLAALKAAGIMAADPLVEGGE